MYYFGHCTNVIVYWVNDTFRHQILVFIIKYPCSLGKCYRSYNKSLVIIGCYLFLLSNIIVHWIHFIVHSINYLFAG